jgi:hypothetical protein
MSIHCRAVKSSLRGTILYTLSMRVRNWCVHWACASGADACTEHARQELMHTLSIRVRNWCMHWAYVLATYVCTERIPFKKCWAYASGNDAYPEHTGQELMHSLNIRVRNWCVPWAYASVSYTYAQCTHQFSRISNVNFVYLQHTHKELICMKATHACTQHSRKELMLALSIYIKELMHVLSICIRNSCVHWAYYTSGTFVCTEHTHQVLMRALTIHVRNLCSCWAYSSIPSDDQYKRKNFKLNTALQNMLSIWMRI